MGEHGQAPPISVCRAWRPSCCCRNVLLFCWSALVPDALSVTAVALSRPALSCLSDCNLSLRVLLCILFDFFVARASKFLRILAHLCSDDAKCESELSL